MTLPPDRNSIHRFEDCRGPRWPRREFLRWSGIGLAGAALGKLPVMAGPFADEDRRDHPVPLDKKLAPEWVESLFARGEPAVYREPAELRHIGIPGS